MTTIERECEAVVIGAGFAGLSAARHLDRAGVDVLVLEARHRVGGRSFTDTSPAGFRIDRGGQWIGPTQDHLAALADEQGVATFPTYVAGEAVELRNGTRTPYVGLIPTSDADAAAEAVAAILDLDLAAFEVPLDAPWTAPNAQALDSATLATHLSTHLTSPAARDIIDVAIKAIFGTGPEEMSLLFALFYLGTGGGLSNLARTTGGAQERRFEGGSQQLAQGLAEGLAGRVQLGAPVESLAHGPDGVTVMARLVDAGADPADPFAAHETLRVRARRAIVAMPPALSGALRYTPPLPGRRRGLCMRMPMGAVTKVHALYDAPFWREDGLNGQLVANEGAVTSTFDDSPEDGSHGALVGFIAGNDCRRMERVDAETRCQVVLSDLARAFGPRALHPIEVVEQHWPGEVFSGGGPVAVASPGALTGYSTALRDPVGPIHWAGTETATQWCGYMDGALSSGVRAADEVIAALSGGGDDGDG